MDLQSSEFNYTVVLKKEQGITSEAFEQFPSMSEISFKSRSFNTYAECVKSCKTLMENVAAGITEAMGDQTFKVGAEVNPLVSGTQTISTDWNESEVARFWIYNKTMEGQKIDAIGRGSLFATDRPEPRLFLN